MKNLINSLTTPLQTIHKGLLLAFLVLAIIGFADATYLTIEHFQNKVPPCAIGGCETVLTSTFASIGPIPVALLGAIFYFVLLLSIMIYWDSKKEIFIRIPIAISLLAGVFAVILIILMVFVIKAICLYCMISDTITIILAILGILILRKNKSNETVV